MYFSLAMPVRSESFAYIIANAKVFRDSPLPPSEVSRNFCHKSESLTHSGPKIELCLKNVPNLAALSFGTYYAKNIIQDKNFHRLSISLLDSKAWIGLSC